MKLDIVEIDSMQTKLVLLEGLENFPYKIHEHSNPFSNEKTYNIKYNEKIGLNLIVEEGLDYRINTLKILFLPIRENITKDNLRKLTNALKKVVVSLDKTSKVYKSNKFWVEYKLWLRDVKDIVKVLEIMDSYLLIGKLSKEENL